MALHEITIYQPQGRNWFQEGMDSLGDRIARAAVLKRLARIRSGNFGQVKSLGEGLWEVKLDVGAGYRLHFFKPSETAVMLLWRGSKRSQRADIRTARAYLRRYREDRKFNGDRL